MRVSSERVYAGSSAYRVDRLNVSAAKPDAEDARPAAVGKLFSEQMRSGHEESCERVVRGGEKERAE